MPLLAVENTRSITMEKLLNGLVALLAVALMAFGVYSLAAVDALGPMTGLSPEGALGLSEMRAIYGSFLIQGLLMFWALARPAVRAPVLMVLGITWAGYIAMRLLSIAMDGFAPAMTPGLASEAVVEVVVIAAACARRPLIQ